MTTLSIFVCPAGSQSVDTDAAGNEIGACAPGMGSYQAVDVDQPFDASQLDSSSLAGAWTAGFVVMGVGLVIAWPGRMLLRAIMEVWGR